jgi:uncharacterized protein
MRPQIHYLLELTDIDLQLDDFQEDFGDLPNLVKILQNNVNRNKELVDETTKILNDVRNFSKNAEKTLTEFSKREKQLSEKQFKVRNNKEFDAITKEIDHIRQERNKINTELSTIGVKEENILRTLTVQTKELNDVQKELDEKEEELEVILSDQNEDVKQLQKSRKAIVKNVELQIIEEYERIRSHLKDAVVRIRKHSCSGCFSSVPHQKIVEIRNNPDKLYNCENCGRILYPEDTED